MISVIIPTHNNEDTIETAINSVLGQSYRDYEIIVVNDKSTDKTIDKLMPYFSILDTRLTILNNDKNVGPGESRRRALQVAQGEFVFFLDSDDHINPDCLEGLRIIQRQQDADIVYAPVHIVYPANLANHNYTQKMEDVVMTGEGRLALQVTDDQMKFVTGKLFRRSLFDKFDFSSRRVGEDVEALFLACYFATTVRSTSFCGYNHVFREGSVLANKPLFYRYCINAEVSQTLIDFLDEHNENEMRDFFLIRAMAYHRDMKKKMKDPKIVDPVDVKKNKKLWNKVCDWYKSHPTLTKNVQTQVDNVVIIDKENDPSLSHLTSQQDSINTSMVENSLANLKLN